jgi:acid stress-induced BolA-like protein IbaG/YrbA
MTELEIKDKIKAHIVCQYVDVSGDGHHFNAYVVSDAFEGKNSVARQQLVYASVKKEIATGDLHALSIKTKTPNEHQQSLQ